MVKSNSQIDFTDLARRTMGELENGLNEVLFQNKPPKIGDKVDVFNPKGKYSRESWWGPDEFLTNAEVVKINGQKITVKDLNDDEYEVDLTDVHS
jgi:hypothetical protein